MSDSSLLRRRHYLLNVVVMPLSPSKPPSHNVAAMACRRVQSDPKNQCTAKKFLKDDEVDEVGST